LPKFEDVDARVKPGHDEWRHFVRRRIELSEHVGTPRLT
jgi:hypothetical protein